MIELLQLLVVSLLNLNNARENLNKSELERERENRENAYSSEYKKHSIGGGDVKLDRKTKKEISKLIKLGFNLDKIRITNVPGFTYNHVKDIINPKLDVSLPMMSDGRFDNTKEEILHYDRSDIESVNVKSYSIKGGIDDLINRINNSKLGGVFYIDTIDLNNKQEDELRCIDLDTRHEK
jgi:hypothetical protein